MLGNIRFYFNDNKHIYEFYILYMYIILKYIKTQYINIL